MTGKILDELEIEQAAEQHFKQKLDIKQIVARDVPTGNVSYATVFLAAHNNMYVYIKAEAPMLLDDVRKMVNRMGLEAEEFLPPRGDNGYFDAVGRERFKSVFPGREVVTDEDLIFYRRLAPYNPALVKISAIKTGEIRRFVSQGMLWPVAVKFSYRKIKTS
jgi:hypothetical protein